LAILVDLNAGIEMALMVEGIDFFAISKNLMRFYLRWYSEFTSGDFVVVCNEVKPC
jgi:hypothetical protein